MKHSSDKAIAAFRRVVALASDPHTTAEDREALRTTVDIVRELAEENRKLSRQGSSVELGKAILGALLDIR